jgi:hypothetical protein
VRGEWSIPLEGEYQALRAHEAEFAAGPGLAGLSPADQATATQAWQAAVARHDVLRFARLCHYLRLRGPDALIGHSILVFELETREVADATAGPITAWSALIEQAAARKR